MGAAITGGGIAVPSDVLANDQLAARLGISEEWIVERTGVMSRRIAGEHESTVSLAVDAGRAALEATETDAALLDLVVVATSTPDHQIPASAPLVQHALGAERAGALDLGAACAGFLYALALTSAWVEQGDSRRALVCGADVLSRVADYSDPKSCVLFGDGAGAVVVENTSESSRLGPFRLHSDGSHPELLWVPPTEGVLKMNGREVYRRAVEAMVRSVQDLLASAGVRVDDIDLVIAHQANARIVDAVAERLGIPRTKAYCNIDHFGNTSAASIPIALIEAEQNRRLQTGDLVVITAFGAGFVWGAGMLRWGTAVADAWRAVKVAHA